MFFFKSRQAQQKTVKIKLASAVYDRLIAVCARQGKSADFFVADAIECYLNSCALDSHASAKAADSEQGAASNQCETLDSVDEYGSEQPEPAQEISSSEKSQPADGAAADSPITETSGGKPSENRLLALDYDDVSEPRKSRFFWGS